MVNEIVKRHLNQPAKKVAIIQMLAYLCLGYFLKIMLNHYRATWTAPEYAMMKGYFRAAHVHGLTLSFTLLFYSFLINFSGASEKVKIIGVTLAILGMTLMPLSLVLSGFGIKLLILSHAAVIMIIASVGILAYAHLTKG